MSEHQQGTGNGRLRRVGALWKPKPGAKSFGSGSMTINGLRQRFVVLRNDKKQEGSTQPDFVLMSGDPPEVDQYAHDRQAVARSTAPAVEAEPLF
jgi:hypothetical protein